MRGANSDLAENLRRALENESALAFGEETLDPGNQISGPPLVRRLASFFAQTLSNPPLTSRKRVDTLKEAA